MMKENYNISLRDIWLYTPGSYKASFQVKSRQQLIQFQVNPADQFMKSQNGSYIMRAWQQSLNQTEPIQLNRIFLDIEVDREIFPRDISLHISILKLDSCRASTSEDDGYFCTSSAKLLLQPKKVLFPTIDNNKDEVQHNGTLKLFSLLPNEQVKSASGYVKYSMLFSKPMLEKLDITETDEEEEMLHNEESLSVPQHTTSKKDAQPKEPVKVMEKKMQEEDVLPITLAVEEAEILPYTLNCDFPDINAIKNLLPKYHSLSTQPTKSRKLSVTPHVPIEEPDEPEVESRGATVEQIAHQVLSPTTKNSLETHVLAVLDYQTKEIDRYRGVIRKVGEDCMELRNQISKLKHEKSELVTKLYYAGENTLDDEFEGEHDVNSQLVNLKRRLGAENEERKQLEERVCSLQNKMIKKNEMEASYIQLQQAHEIQQKMLQQLQLKLTKYKLLESTCRKQEEVIEEMEKKIESMKGNNNKEPNINNGIMKQKPENITFENNMLNSIEISEKIRLMQKLEQAEGTIAVLQEQLQTNASKWAKEKTNLQLTFNGNRNRFQTMVPISDRPTMFNQPRSYRSYQERSVPKYHYRGTEPFL